MPRPRTIAEIPTPALLVDVQAMERNIRRMAKAFVLSLPVLSRVEGSKHAQRHR